MVPRMGSGKGSRGEKRNGKEKTERENKNFRCLRSLIFFYQTRYDFSMFPFYNKISLYNNDNP